MASGAGQRVAASSSSQPLQANTNLLNRGPDPALLRPSIKTSVTGVRQIIKALEASSPEIRDYLLNEVNIVYECKVCMNMFRSLANLTAHKRSYCLEKFEDVTHVFSSKSGVEAAELRTVIVEGETVDTVVPEDNTDTENYSPSLDLLIDSGIITALEEKPLVNRLLPPKKTSLSSVVEKLAAKRAKDYVNHISKKVDIADKNSNKTDVVYMEPIAGTDKAQFQTYSTGFKYKEIQALNSPVSVVVGEDGKEVATSEEDRSKSPAHSDESKENHEEYDPNVPVDDNGNQIKYPCPECKKGFTQLGNTYKHMRDVHGMKKDEYTKLRKEIQDNAYVVDKADGLEKPQKAALQNIAMAIGLVNKQGVGMQKINKPAEKPGDKRSADTALSELQAPRPRGRPPKNRSPEVAETKKPGNDEDSDTEVTFNPGSLSPGAEPGPKRGKKRGRPEGSPGGLGSTAKGMPQTNAWRGGKYECVLCDRSFGTPTFLMQHYVSPHFSQELRAEFGAHLDKRKCPHCGLKFDNVTKLMMHIGCTHREVHKYLPAAAKDLMPGTRPDKLASPAKASPVKVARTPAPAADMFQKFAANIVKGGGRGDNKRTSPKGQSTVSLIPHIKDEFMS